MATNITLNSYNLQSDTVKTKSVAHTQGPEQQLTQLEIARRDKDKLVASSFGSKKIIINGTIKGTSQSNLESNIDTFKKNITGTEMNLDIAYGTSTRRYKVSLESVTITRDYYHLLFAPFEISLRAIDPAGYGTSTVSKTWTGITTTDYTGTLTAEGTFYPEPTITITVNTATNLTRIQITNTATGDEILCQGTIVAGDVIKIDIENLTVLQNTNSMTYQGKFPKFGVGENKWECTFTATATKNVDIEIEYVPRYF